MKLLTKSAVLLASGFLATSANAAYVLVDDFTTTNIAGTDEDQIVTADQNFGNTFDSDSTGCTSCMGSYRDLTVESLLDPDSPGTEDSKGVVQITTTPDDFADSDQYNWINDPGAYSNATIVWDGGSNVWGVDLDPADLDYNLGAPDLTYASILIDVISADDNAFNFDIALFTDEDNWTRITLRSQGTTGLISFDLSLWETPNGGCNQDYSASTATGEQFSVVSVECGSTNTLASVVDLSDVNALEISYHSLHLAGNGSLLSGDEGYGSCGTANAGYLCRNGADVSIDSVAFRIPTPGTLALMGSVLMGLGWSRRRRSKAVV